MFAITMSEILQDANSDRLAYRTALLERSVQGGGSPSKSWVITRRSEHVGQVPHRLA